ncbi:efflux RND transporter permease subunit [Magnetovibrio blakemorei]|uniref:Multidrug transporter AcrB n=1 Tax=Magnetovibrio blakemorei TaxID=28181 RepID=A0A1E5Q882_9PROT|nr:efflux RND transporter permease subunit [Magnetovibrio blakemorei]OEJ67367.1 multidrug transporter AcrB [Magnetovibrio blakemorei]
MPHLSDLPSLSVRRPVLIIVINLLILIAGLGALTGMEVRELPNVDKPLVTVRMNWDGASPETMDAEVTSVIEGAVARVAGVQSIDSASEENNARVRITFYPNVNLETAANDIREAVAAAERNLPDGVDNITVIKADDNATPIMRLAAYSDTLNQENLTRLIEDDISSRIAAVPGVAAVQQSGNRAQVMRVIVDPLRLTAYGLSIDDLSTTLKRARLDIPAGSFKSADQLLLVRANASITTPDGIEALEISDNIRVGDVATAIYGPQAAETYTRLDGRSVVGMDILRQAKSNTIAIADRVDALIQRINDTRTDVHIVKTSDDALFIRGAVREVIYSLGLAIVIVIGVIYAFIGGLRATLIPAVTIPVSLIGTLVAIWMLGFSINMLTLLALVLGTGMIVDDAIVVLENIQRLRAQGIKPLAAAVMGTRQVYFAVLASTATLISVFLPIAFLPGTAGRLFTEFSFVLAIAVSISSFVALSLCSMLSSRLPADAGHKTGALREPLAAFGERMIQVYRKSLDIALGARFKVLLGALLIAGLAGGLYFAIQQELIPEEDRGLLLTRLRGPDGVGPDYMDRQAAQAEEIMRPLREAGEITAIYSMVGRYDPNLAIIVAPLAPWSERSRGQSEIITEINKKLRDIPGVSTRVYSTNSLGIRGGGEGLSFAVTGTNYEAIAAATDTLISAIEQDMPGLRDLNMSYKPTQPQLSISIDRRRAEDLGAPVAGITDTLRAMVSGFEVAQLNIDDRQVPIILESATGAINDPGDLYNLFVSAGDNRLVPLASFITMEEKGIAAQLDRTAQKRAITISASLEPGYTIDRAITDLTTLAAKVLPPGNEIVLQGEAATLTETSREVALTFVIAIVVVLLVLAAQFESFMSAVVVVLTVPFGLAAAIFALSVTGTSINIYSQIGLVMLVGLMAKNGILVVEFADQLRDQGHDVLEAVRTSAMIRLRPVMMTMLSTVMGGLPLILGSGPGAEARAAIGWVIFGGLGIATVFTLFLVPVIYSLLAPYSKPRAQTGDKLRNELDHSLGPDKDIEEEASR